MKRMEGVTKANSAVKFKIIQKEKWKRKEHFDFFSKDSGSSLYDITTFLDVTAFVKYVKQNKLSFYYSLIWVATEVMNNIVDFRYKIRGNDIVLFDRLIPAFTDLKSGSELFHIIAVDFCGDMAKFTEEAKRISEESKDYFPESMEDYEEDELIQFSCLPWFSFTSLNLEKSNDRDDSVPKITWGKYEQFGESMRLPFSIQVNHRLIDGVHLGNFINLLQNYIDNFAGMQGLGVEYYKLGKDFKNQVPEHKRTARKR